MANVKRRKKCKCCGSYFYGYAARSYCSPLCRKKSVKPKKREIEPEEAPRSRVTPKLTVADVMSWIERYREKNGVLLSYGKAVLLIERGVEV